VFGTTCVECRHVRDHERRFNTCDLFGGVLPSKASLNGRERNVLHPANRLGLRWDSGGSGWVYCARRQLHEKAGRLTHRGEVSTDPTVVWLTPSLRFKCSRYNRDNAFMPCCKGNFDASVSLSIAYHTAVRRGKRVSCSPLRRMKADQFS